MTNATETGCRDFCWMIGGPQGTGVDSSATLFARAAAAAGYWIYGRREYHSNIKGKHSYFQIRVRPDPVLAHTDPVNLLATFEPTTADYHAFEIIENGALIYDPHLTHPAALELKPGILTFPIEFDAILAAVGEAVGKSATQLSILKNAIAVSASCALVGIPLSAIETALKGIFTDKKASLVALNMRACTLGYEAIQQLPGFAEYPYKLVAPTPPAAGSRALINGNQATAIAKMRAGCKLQTYYSITPAVDECVFMEEFPETGIAVVQCEDELAAVNMAIGGATTGVRASTSTSGPGFCLMSEGLGFAGICEIPLVVFNYMRGGPSTGLPTRNEQGDLLFTLHTGHGEYPKIIIASGDVTEQYHDTFEAFNLADRYQTVVLMLSDRSIANNTFCVPVFDESKQHIDRGHIVGPPDTWNPAEPETGLTKFARFSKADGIISARAVAGTPGRIHWLTGDESDEWGHITEKPEVRVPMHQKRMEKLDMALSEIPEAFQYTLHGPESADITLVSWGSTKGAILEAMPVLRETHGITVNFLQIRLMNPFPTEAVQRILSQANFVACVENNLTGQLAQLIQMRTCLPVQHKVLKWTGRPMSDTEMIAAVRELHAHQPKEVVLTYGL
ncbi:MAG: 2-oxoacid:acceptor oxidoreductase subunit alpha [Candidatus Melainabacteria bacterium]